MNFGKTLQSQISQFLDYSEVQKSIKWKSFKFYVIQNDHNNFTKSNDRDLYVTTIKWFTYLEQRVVIDKLARLALACDSAIAIILVYASNSASWQKFMRKEIDRYICEDFQVSAIPVAEIYEIYFNEILNILQKIQNDNPNLFFRIGLIKSIFLASILAALRQKFEIDELLFSECIDKSAQKVNGNGDRLVIEHRVGANKLSHTNRFRSGTVEQSVPLEGINAVITMQNELRKDRKGNIFQGTRLVQQGKNSSSFHENVSTNRGKFRQIKCNKCQSLNHYDVTGKIFRASSGKHSKGQGGYKGRKINFCGNNCENRSGRCSGAKGPPESYESVLIVKSRIDENTNQYSDPNENFENNFYAKQ